MVGNYVNRLGGVCGASSDHHGTLPEAELWTQVILQAINDLEGRTSLTPRSAKDSAREWFASESDAVSSFLWTCQIIDVDPDFIRSQLAKKLRMKNPVEVMPSIAQGAKALRRKNSPLPDMLDRAEGPQALKRLAV
jgi:hypothetical protein